MFTIQCIIHVHNTMYYTHVHNTHVQHTCIIQMFTIHMYYTPADKDDMFNATCPTG